MSEDLCSYMIKLNRLWRLTKADHDLHKLRVDVDCDNCPGCGRDITGHYFWGGEE